MEQGITLSASDVRALRGCHQRGGGPLTAERVQRFLALGLVNVGVPACGSELCSTCSLRYTLTGRARVWLHSRGQLPGCRPVERKGST